MTECGSVPHGEDVLPGGEGQALSRLVDDHRAQLADLDALLTRMDAAEYARPNGRDASIGQHVRHLLDHYETLLRCEDPRVDHTIRAREELVANCRRTALDRVRTVQGRRDQWADRRGPFRGDPDGSGGESGVGGVMEVVYLPDGPESDPAAYRVRSTLERELLFVLSHTIHQMALIAILASHGGMPVPDGFGVASSTKRQRR